MPLLVQISCQLNQCRYNDSLDPLEYLPVKFELKTAIFMQENLVEKVVCKNGGHFVLASIYYMLCTTSMFRWKFYNCYAIIIQVTQNICPRKWVMLKLSRYYAQRKVSEVPTVFEKIMLVIIIPQKVRWDIPIKYTCTLSGWMERSN